MRKGFQIAPTSPSCDLDGGGRPPSAGLKRPPGVGQKREKAPPFGNAPSKSVQLEEKIGCAKMMPAFDALGRTRLRRRFVTNQGE